MNNTKTDPKEIGCENEE